MSWFKSRALHNFKSLPQIDSYLEVGVWTGDSFFWVMNNLKPSWAVGVDPYPDDRKRRDGTNKAIADRIKAKWAKHFSHVKGYLRVESSLTALPALLVESGPEFYDLIYVDGSHHGADVFCDAAMALMHCKPGGHIIFDDFVVRMTSNVAGLRLAVDTLQRLSLSDFEVVAVNSQVVLHKFEKSKRKEPIDKCLVGPSLLSADELAQDMSNGP